MSGSGTAHARRPSHPLCPPGPAWRWGPPVPTPPSPAWLSPAPSSSAPGPTTRLPATLSPSTLRVRERRGARGGHGGGGVCQHIPPLPLPQGTRARSRAPWSSTSTSRTSGWERPSPAGTANCWWVHLGGMWAALGGGGVGTQPVPSPCPGLCPAAALERDGGAAGGVPHPDGHLLRAEPGPAERRVVFALPRPDHGQHLPPDKLR